MLTEKGYQRPTYNELLEKQIERAKSLFGDDIDTSETSIMGKMIRLDVYDYAEIYEDLEKLYYARFPNTATGISLDRLLPFAGITRNLATHAQHKIRIHGNAGAAVEAGMVLVEEAGTAYTTIEDCIIGEDGTADVQIECVQPGSVGNYIKSLELESPSADITNIDYLSRETEGQDRESDTAARRRFNMCKSSSGNMTANSVKGAIMQIPNVVAVEVFENKTNDTVNNIPPHAFKCYVLCPNYVEYQVAEAIFSKKPLGIPCVGDLNYQVKDDGGQFHEVKFSKSEPVETVIKLTVKVNEYFETNGEEDIKNNLIEHISSLENGQDIIFTSLYGQIHKVPGVVETLELKLAKKGEDLSVQNIHCEIYQVADLDKEDIMIKVVRDE